MDVDGVGGQAAAELAVEGAAPRGGAVVDIAPVPVGLGGCDRSRPRQTLADQVVQLLDAVAEPVLEDRADPLARSGFGGGHRVELGEALAHRLLDDGMEARFERRDRLGLVQRRRGADVDDVEVAREKVVQPLQRRGDAELLRHRPAARRVDVAERGHFVEIGQGGIAFDVRSADPGADDADPEAGHAAAPFSMGMARRWAARASSMARKQWSWGMAVSVRLMTSSRSRAP